MKLAILLAGLLALLFVRVQTGYACSGGGDYSVQTWLAERDTVVFATVLEVDDRGQNAILQVDRYFKGHDGKYLTVMRFPAALEYAAGIRSYATSCLYDGGNRLPWVDGTSGYFLLSNNGNGTYADILSQYVRPSHYFVVDGRVKYYDIEVKKYGSITASVDDFEAILLEAGNRKAALAPDADDSAYPLRRFLNITTESGQRYQLNPDRTLTQLADDYPIAISPDGSHVAFRLDDETIGFQYYWLKQDFDEVTGQEWPQPQPGRALRFSPNSDYAAVWNDAQMTVFMFDNYERRGYGQRMTMQPIAQAELHWSHADSLPVAVWSADSTTLAFTDQAGIWRWNLFADAEPQLALAADSVPALMDLSRSGRYVRYGTNTAWTLLDTITGEPYTNAIATPDESNLIFIRGDFPDDTPDLNRKGDRECRVPLAQTCPIYIQRDNVVETFWYNNDQIAVLSCNEDGLCYIESYSWRLAFSSMDNYDQRLQIPLGRVQALDYDLFHQQAAVVIGDYRLAFGFYQASHYEDRLDRLDIVDLTGQVDSPIVSVEWGQPTVYDHRLP